MRRLFILPVAFLGLGLAACSTTDGARQASDTSADCYHLTGAALVDCQRTTAPAADVKEPPFKMVKPQKGAGGMRGNMF